MRQEAQAHRSHGKRRDLHDCAAQVCSQPSEPQPALQVLGQDFAVAGGEAGQVPRRLLLQRLAHATTGGGDDSDDDGGPNHGGDCCRPASVSFQHLGARGARPSPHTAVDCRGSGSAAGQERAAVGGGRMLLYASTGRRDGDRRPSTTGGWRLFERDDCSAALSASRHGRYVRERRRMCTRKGKCEACTSTGEPKCQTPGAAAVCTPEQEMPSACGHLSSSALCVCSCYMVSHYNGNFILKPDSSCGHLDDAR